MPTFTISEPERPTRTHTFDQSLVVIGRGNEADVVLFDLSVSRSHARLVLGDEGAMISDMGTKSGTFLNGAQVDRARVADGDRIQVGRAQLVYSDLSAGRSAEQGESESAVHARIRSSAKTHYTTPAEISESLADYYVRDNAELRLVEDPTRRWRCGERGLEFGGKGGIPVQGALGRGVLATLSWNGAGHMVRRESSVSRVHLNGESVREAGLLDGDEITIGRTRFVYRVP